MKYLFFLISLLFTTQAHAQGFIHLDAELPKPTIKYNFIEKEPHGRSYRLEALPPYEARDLEERGLTRAQWLYLALHALDYKQTMKIAANPDRYAEKNKILGAHPSKEAVTGYFIASGILYVVLTEMMGDDIKETFARGSVLGKFKVVLHNDKVGL